MPTTLLNMAVRATTANEVVMLRVAISEDVGGAMETGEAPVEVTS